MEPAKIDWKTIHSEFIHDDNYEHVNAPQWMDFLAPDGSALDHDDEAWFCSPAVEISKCFKAHGIGRLVSK
ncbi:hypothetical protein Ancab_015684, partial [Ancistrocladus abbreviatus]